MAIEANEDFGMPIAVAVWRVRNSSFCWTGWQFQSNWSTSLHRS